jgi:hypothetical protein
MLQNGHVATDYLANIGSFRDILGTNKRII